VAVVEIRGLVKRYGELVAVDGLDLDVGQGETLALLGPNGAGKTSTVECCEGYRRPDAGSVRVLGLDPIADARRLRPRVGLMLQEGGLYPHVRPEEVLRTFAAFHVAPEDPDRLIEVLGLEAVRRTRYRQLSGGEKQRLALALALIGRPEVLFLDEPTAGLDPVARRTTWRLLAERTAQGATIILTTHLLAEAASVADRVAIIDRGRLRALGTPAELTSGGASTVRMRTSPPLAAPVVAAALGIAVETEEDGVLALRAVADADLLAALARLLAEHGAVLVDLHTGGGTLEAAYLRLVDRLDSDGTDGDAR
jgi:ABC-2 type transport system ATP-binding protein